MYPFPRERRLTRGGDLNAVRREGKRIRTGHLEVRAVASLLPYARVGFVVPKYNKFGSVERNRLKRRLREIVRTCLLPGLPAADLVVRPSPAAYAASFDTLREELERVGEKVARWVRDQPRPEPPA